MCHQYYIGKIQNYQKHTMMHFIAETVEMISPLFTILFES